MRHQNVHHTIADEYLDLPVHKLLDADSLRNAKAVVQDFNIRESSRDQRKAFDLAARQDILLRFAKTLDHFPNLASIRTGRRSVVAVVERSRVGKSRPSCLPIPRHYSLDRNNDTIWPAAFTLGQLAPFISKSSTLSHGLTRLSLTV